MMHRQINVVDDLIPEVSSHSVSRRVREMTELNFTALVLLSHASESTVYLSVHRASVLVYQLFLTLFSYSFGPVTPGPHIGFQLKSCNANGNVRWL
jgi:hypothetical protein